MDQCEVMLVSAFRFPLFAVMQLALWLSSHNVLCLLPEVWLKLCSIFLIPCVDGLPEVARMATRRNILTQLQQSRLASFHEPTDIELSDWVGRTYRQLVVRALITLSNHSFSQILKKLQDSYIAKTTIVQDARPS